MIRPRSSIVLVIFAIALAACSSSEVKKNLGLSKKAPDEFRVVPRPPLSVPPEFTLRPPSKDGDPASQFGTSPNEEAKSLILGDTPGDKTLEEKSVEGTAETAVPPVTSGELESPAESSFLHQAGAGAADPEIRDALRADQAQKKDEEEEDSWWAGWWPGKDKKKETVVDPEGEADRIRTNKDEGKPITEGETPVEEKKSQPLLDKLLGH